MISKVIDKYDILYESAIEFTCRVGLTRREDIEYVTDNELKDFCTQHKVTLPPALWSYSRFFGNGVGIKNSEYIVTHDLSNYIAALALANMRHEEYGNMNLKEFLTTRNFKVNYDDASPDDNEGIYTPALKSLMNIDDIFVYFYDPFNRAFKFLDSSKENPFTFYLIKYECVTSYFASFTNRFRDILFMFILNMAPLNFKGASIFNERCITITPAPHIDYSDGFECIKTYQEVFGDLSAFQRERLKKLRSIFYELNNGVEQRENRILSFTEFENKFIDFLKDEKWF